MKLNSKNETLSNFKQFEKNTNFNNINKKNVI